MGYKLKTYLLTMVVFLFIGTILFVIVKNNYRIVVTEHNRMTESGALVSNVNFDIVKRSDVESLAISNANKTIQFVEGNTTNNLKYSELGIKATLKESTNETIDDDFVLNLSKLKADYDTKDLESYLLPMNDNRNTEKIVDVSRISSYIRENIGFHLVINLEDYYVE